MPIVKKEKITRKTIEKQFVFDSFRLFEKGGKNELSGVESRNCDCEGGVLTTGLGLEKYYLPNGVSPELFFEVRACHVVQIKDVENGSKATTELYITESQGNTYKYQESVGAFVKYMSAMPTTKILTIWEHGKGTNLFFIAPTKIYWEKAGKSERKQLCAENRGLACICKNRLFYAYKDHDIAYTDPDAPDDWSESIEGYGVLYSNEREGYVQGLATLGDSVIVLYENGLKKINVAGSPKDFVIEKIEYHGKTVYYNTACVCGNALFFLAADGVYRYDGKEVKRACENMPIYPAEDNKTCLSAHFYDEYLLFYSDKKRGKRILVIKGDGKLGYFTDPALGLSSNMDKPLVQVDTLLYEYSRDAARASGAYDFSTDFLDFGTSRKKTLKKLTLYGEGSCYVSMQTGNVARKDLMTFENGVAVFQLMERGESFAFRIQLEPDSKVKKMVADIVYF